MTGMHLAELNVGRLIAPVDDPRVLDFMDNLDRVNGLAKRMPGFQWMMEGAAGAGNTDAAIGGDAQFIPNISVWENVATLEKFVWGTIHKQFYERRAEWFDVLGAMHFVMWWVPEGRQPNLEEALARLDHLRENGDSDHAFGWSYLEDAKMWRSHGCTHIAAE
ncbi:MAG: DUF3291 domain-containing protein [Sulfitobacter sp.]